MYGVAYLRHPINLRLFNWRVPALADTQPKQFLGGTVHGKVFLRFSFNGSLSEFSTAWPGGEDGGGDRANGKFQKDAETKKRLKRMSPKKIIEAEMETDLIAISIFHS